MSLLNENKKGKSHSALPCKYLSKIY